ncbi:MAG TPA: hypothetical protein P5189_01240 [Methanomassiliicoccales archaeon]|nr:hypothetical protein [Methanomassiliicoccales archaeon]
MASRVRKEGGRRRLRKNRHLPPREKAIQLALTVATWSSVLALAAVFGELLLGALPALSSISIIDFFTGTVWNPSHPIYPLYGILPLFVGTMMVSFGARSSPSPSDWDARSGWPSSPAPG